MHHDNECVRIRHKKVIMNICIITGASSGLGKAFLVGISLKSRSHPHGGSFRWPSMLRRAKEKRRL